MKKKTFVQRVYKMGKIFLKIKGLIKSEGLKKITDEKIWRGQVFINTKLWDNAPMRRIRNYTVDKQAQIKIQNVGNNPNMCNLGLQKNPFTSSQGVKIIYIRLFCLHTRTYWIILAFFYIFFHLLLKCFFFYFLLFLPKVVCKNTSILSG